MRAGDQGVTWTEAATLAGVWGFVATIACYVLVRLTADVLEREVDAFKAAEWIGMLIGAMVFGWMASKVVWGG